MSHPNTSLTVLFAVAMSALHVDVGAAEQQWYIGLDGGSGEAEVIGHDRTAQFNKVLARQGYTASSAFASEDDNTSVISFVGGYQVNTSWAVEASYLDLGETSGRFAATVTAPSAGTTTGKVSSEYDALSVAAVGSYALPKRFYLQGRLGVHYWRHEHRFTGGSPGLPVRQTLSDSGVSWILGAGIGVEILPDWDIRLQWRRFDGVENEDGIDTKTVTLLYRL